MAERVFLGGSGTQGADGADGPAGPAGPTGPAGDPATNLVTSVSGRQGVVVLVKGDVGLSNVDNTSDVDKPVSTAQATANTADRARANHTGTQFASTISDFSTAADARIAADTTVKQPLDADLTVIAGLAPANDSILQRKGGVWVGSTPATLKTDLILVKGDVGLSLVDNTADASKPVSTAQAAANVTDRARANHTGTQLAVTISDFSAAADARIAADVTVKQPLDSDLTTIAALAPANDTVLQRKGGVWAASPPATVKADLVLVKADVGLSNVDNTADAGKPVSAAQATADGLRVLKAGDTLSGALLVTLGTDAPALRTSITGDANQHWQVFSGGYMEWSLGGPGDTYLMRRSAGVLGVPGLQIDGGGSAKLLFSADGNLGDTNLYRSAASQLKTDSAFVVAGISYTLAEARSQVATSGDVAFGVLSGGAGARQLAIMGDGALRWSSGAAAYDTNLYRSAVASLTTDGNLYASLIGSGYFTTIANTNAYIQMGVAGGVVVINRTTATNVPLTIKGMAAQSGSLQQWQDSTGANLVWLTADGKLTFGDVNIYRTAAAVAAIDGQLYLSPAAAVPGLDVNRNAGIKVRAGATDGFVFEQYGTNSWQWRPLSGAGTFKVGDSLAIAGTVGFYNTAPVAKPAVTGSRGGNAALASLLTALAATGLLTDSTSA